MLLNILNTLAIACSLGINAHFSNVKNEKRNAPMPNRATENINITIANEYTTQYDYNTATYTGLANGNEFKVENYNAYYSNFEIQMRHVFMTSQYITLGNSNTPNYEFNDGTYAHRVYAQEMYFIRINGTYGITNQVINLKNYCQFNNIYSSTIKWRYRALSTITNINEYLSVDLTDTLTTIATYTENDNLYDVYDEIIYNAAGYSTSVKSGNIEAIEQDYRRYYELQLDLPYTYGKNNYFVVYLQPYLYRTAQTPEQTINNTMPLYIDTRNDLFNVSFNAVKVITGENVEVIDIPSIMFTVLGMPFTFISTAFNLTLFPGTPYQVNISMLFLGLFAVLVFVFLIKLILGKFK